jgi:hypothetical protein
MSLRAHAGAPVMFEFLSRIAHFLSPRAADGADFPSTLLESADARAGRDPRQAQELRAAAEAAMRVVR